MKLRELRQVSCVSKIVADGNEIYDACLFDKYNDYEVMSIYGYNVPLNWYESNIGICAELENSEK